MGGVNNNEHLLVLAKFEGNAVTFMIKTKIKPLTHKCEANAWIKRKSFKVKSKFSQIKRICLNHYE